MTEFGFMSLDRLQRWMNGIDLIAGGASRLPEMTSHLVTGPGASKSSLLNIVQINTTSPWYRPDQPATSAPVSYKRIQQWVVCRRERSRWFHVELSLHSAHWGVPRRPGLSSAPPSLTWCQTWGGGKASAGWHIVITSLRCVAELINISETGEMLSASVTTWNS